ncbi:hypothetical protein HOY82DRAFT_651192 [Tuber indicum]|nr:hypothetical protein HOY82DRAFT_651192 [Tuber indicum]
MAQQILSIIGNVLKANHPKFLVFSNLEREVGSQIIESLEDPRYNIDESSFRLHYSAPDGYLRLVMPTRLHESPVSWMFSESWKWLLDGRVEEANFREVKCYKPTCDRFIGPYAGSKKDPDFTLTPVFPARRIYYPSAVPESGFSESITYYPSVVLESGLSESDTQVMRDSRLWLEGTGGAVKVVVLCKTSAPDWNNKIKATLTLCRIAPNGEILRADWQVFPVPERDLPNPYITVDELFGGCVPDSIDPNVKLPLDIQRLREALDMGIRKTGYRTTQP